MAAKVNLSHGDSQRYFIEDGSRARINDHDWERCGVPRRPGTSYAFLAVTVVAFFIASYVGLALRRQASEARRYLSENSARDDRIFIWGHSARIYMESRQCPACRNILTFPLISGNFPSAPLAPSRPSMKPFS
jgi:hypothetical protein